MSPRAGKTAVGLRLLAGLLASLVLAACTWGGQAGFDHGPERRGGRGNQGPVQTT
jgi:hypothetical protein